MRRTFLFFGVALLLAATVFAQTSTTATLRGKITNDAGTGVANAEINAVNAGNGFVKTVKSGSDGAYTLAGLSPGTYNI
ncbi:MAG: carboxypeptidase regulatory-like domain-containing protein, partial [Acidobacteria bacterium]|nr:carboxypeptidase regulatory-like domain-containing protein [Acidobacteriota bacterium]